MNRVSNATASATAQARADRRGPTLRVGPGESSRGNLVNAPYDDALSASGMLNGYQAFNTPLEFWGSASGVLSRPNPSAAARRGAAPSRGAVYGVRATALAEIAVPRARHELDWHSTSLVA